MYLTNFSVKKSRSFYIYKGLFLSLLLTMAFVEGTCQKANSSNEAFSTGVLSILKNIHTPVFKTTTYSLSSYGAIPDGKTNIKPLIDSIISLCSKRGGGHVVIPKGRYFVAGPVILKSHVDLHFETGATLIFSTEPKDYLPLVLTRWEGTELFNYCPQIYAYQCTDIAITGKGTLEGSASANFARWRPQGSNEQSLLREMGSKATPLPERVFGERAHFPPSMIQFWGCSNILIEDMTVTDAPYWVIHPVYCNNVTVRNVIIQSLNLNNDGCDPESSSNVLIEHCNFTVGDDAIALKAGRDQDGWRTGRPTENVVVRNCTFRSKTNGLCIGSEMSAGVRSIYFENIRMSQCFSAIYFKSNLDRGGYIENIHVRNITCDSARSACIRFENNYHGGRGGHYPTLFKDFYIENVQCTYSGEVGIYALGIEDMPLRNIFLKNIRVHTTPQPQILDHVQNLTYQQVWINSKKVQPKTTTALKLHTD